MNSQRVWTINMEELRMRKICAKMVPRLLTDQQKERRVQVCQDILTRLETDPTCLGRTITGDESWIFEYDPFTKRQSLEWKSPTSPRPKKARKVKVMLIAFFDVRASGNSLPKITLLLWINLLTPLTWLSVTFCFQNSKEPLKKQDLIM